ncbi:MAG: thioredoxin [Anaerolineales bacterium]|nr:thioredoxin [Anaerolineales bacterium]
MPSLQALHPWVEYLLERGPKPVTTKPRPQATQPADSGHPIQVSDADFDQVVLQASNPVLVDFWATWCGPCRSVAPIIEGLAGEFVGRALVAKLDVDANPVVAQRYGVRSIPTLIFFHNGREVERAVGAQPANVLRSKLNQLL